MTPRSLRGNDMDNSVGGRSRLTFSVHSAAETDNSRSKRFTWPEARVRGAGLYDGTTCVSLQVNDGK